MRPSPNWMIGHTVKRLLEHPSTLSTRWKRYNFPVQLLLKLLLEKHGVDAATIATDALDRQFSTKTVAVAPAVGQRAISTAYQLSMMSNRKGVLHHERCIKANLV